MSEDQQAGIYNAMRAALFRLDAETAHNQVMRAFSTALRPGPVRRMTARRLQVDSDRLKTCLWDIDFPNPVGMAAGFDKDGSYFNALGALGFGHIEIGTVTAQGQVGNPRPRLFRLVEDEALLNRMGFNNRGSARLAERLSTMPIEPILGINIGKSKVVELEDAAQDYAASLKRLHRFARYLVVNVSSPNTPGLRRLQGKDRLFELLQHLESLNVQLGASSGLGRRPMLLKIAPDLTDEALDDVLAVADEVGLDGIIATNTTISREGLRTSGVDELGAGGISGRPLTLRSRQMVARIHSLTGGKLPIVGVGGVFSAEDALAMIEAGAALVQIWTGFIYGGPLIVREILSGLDELLEKRGVKNVNELVGIESRNLEKSANSIS